MNLLNRSLSTKAQIDLYSYQATTGLKSPTYSGYGVNAYNIVNIEAALGVTQNFMENNKVLDTELKAMNTAMQSINDSISDFKSMLNLPLLKILILICLPSKEIAVLKVMPKKLWSC